MFSKTSAPWLGRPVIVSVIVSLALFIFLFTWIGIRVSREDSFKLLVMQGETFTEVLARSARNAIEAESFYDYLVHRRFSEIVTALSYFSPDENIDISLQRIIQQHNLRAVYICNPEGETISSATVLEEKAVLPDFVIEEVVNLMEEPENNYVLLFHQGKQIGQADHYYLQLANSMDQVYVVVADALYYAEGLKQTQIGYLVRSMAREAGIEYIIYQATDGIIFSSRSTGQLLAIESDSFLTTALNSDTVVHRQYQFQDREVLELVKPFETDEYPFGLFRVGLSLEGYNAVSHGFDRLMAILAAAMFGLMVLGLLYFNSRQKRHKISRQYSEIKSSTDVIFDQMRTGVASINPDGIITIANRAFEHILGLRRVLGRPWNEAVPASGLNLKQLIEWRDQSEDHEIKTIIDNTEKNLLVAVSEFPVTELKNSGLVVVIYDITRLKKYEQISAQRQRLSEMGDLAAGVAHEIRNPLNSITIAAQRLGTEFTPEANQDEYLAFTGEIHKEAKRLNSIMTRFLALARIDGKQLSSIRLSEFFEKFGQLLKLETEELDIGIEIDIQPDITFNADLDSLRELFTNLFNNAKEALITQSDGQIHIVARKKDNFVEIRFSDNGPGIEPELREKVFTPYFTTKEAGTGLGLPTVYRIISDIGGTIAAGESESGGAEFVIKIPMQNGSTL
ncbi:MAG: ATP-binding protein [candidate division Zixibacteria bacterium]|nr:ATP-binding protein [candidate division Zixibacteria bacterium]